MECKNCEKSLRTDYSFCSNCGAKVIRNRLTFKNLWYDVTERYFNLDNTFLKTFLHLFTKPEIVIDGYIKGIRKKYLNPVSYLGIALTLSGLLLFVLRKFALEKIDLDTFGQSMKTETTRKILNASLDISSFTFLLYIPLIAIAGWLIFNKKSHNLSEYSVTGIYSLAHYSIMTFPFSLALCLLAPENYLSLSFIFIAIMAAYITYVVNRIHGKNIGLSLAFILAFGVGFMMVSIFLNIMFLLTGIISIQDLVPQR
ncbi:DUF3667 domain-containing protein [Maribacter algarum]|uniref:DUF3667 domain-containing protein n=1 Tax=Maribacter algarum (ex Zhang et al. 2020) TaxID=2578118 RepID=A0A5S3PXE7_9FLAO|nr:DUF3667 domain-containing protein [Maribacter algarum]TMM57937.1 DUF3667 domain-containing protein [Maribacter algarum]